MKIISPIITIFLLINLVGCATYITKEEFAPKMYTERPLSIVVLPPINNSTAADAKEYYMTTVAEPLTNAGYYVYSTEIVDDILQQEGLYDTETILDAPLEKFKEYFGADAVLFMTIDEWDTQYLLTSGSVKVKVKSELKSTSSGETIWFYDDRISVNTSGSSGGAGGLLGLITQAVTTAISTAATDYVPIARNVSKNIFLALPDGKYNPRYGQDQKDKIKKKEAAVK